MGCQQLIITSDKFDKVRLRSISEDHVDLLRKWKNANKNSFFLKEEISDEQQRKWYRSFFERENDYMFLVEEKIGTECIVVGCMGFRVANDIADIYNVIRGRESLNQARMRDALLIMCSYIKSLNYQKIGCKVLRDNPAVGWYLSAGFVVEKDQGEYYDLTVDWDTFGLWAINVREGEL
jgi:RimJ/RimL family protein N-acetyltransferase